MTCAPFERRHVLGHLDTRAAPLGLLAQHLGQVIAEVSERERARGMGGQVGTDEFAEAALSHHGVEAGEIIVEAVDQAKPILAVIDFDPFETAQAIVGLDESSRDFLGESAVGPLALGSPIIAQGAHDDAGGETLEVFELGSGLPARGRSPGCTSGGFLRGL